MKIVKVLENGAWRKDEIKIRLKTKTMGGKGRI